ncbi:uncharacterized protein LOC115679045 isoform X2 [Syzygium oleosum]|uniref:uncharacterized protein LOC115679045 isoform X2 n=1 Tax=Syzygium oleosum TaxID=219896 RepID=UPI0024B9084B|nr:uncharacterized protein LOC115679045 isoform X2 [Syzygium oleosum]
MAADASLAALYEKLKVEDPWLPPRTWESIPSQSGRNLHPRAGDRSVRRSLFDVKTVSEASLVRLAMNALQGVQSAVVSIEKLSASFCSDPADRSFHRITSLWNRTSSTHSLGMILKSIGRSGCLVFLLGKFVEYFANLHPDIGPMRVRHEIEGELGGRDKCHIDIENDGHLQGSLVNQAFAVALGKILEGYTCSLDTLCASINFRRSTEDARFPADASSGVGCLTNVVLSDISLLEVHSHTEELRTRIEALGNICKLHVVALCFSELPLEDLLTKTTAEFCKFPRGGDLLSYLHEQLQVADPAHYMLLKFLFVRSCAPYLGFVRSWIYQAEINDPYKEFVVEYVSDPAFHPPCKAGSTHVVCVQVQEKVAVPYFLRKSLVPLVRAGQQLQVVMKLFELCNYVSPGSYTFEEFLPNWKDFSSNHSSRASALTFDKENIEDLVNVRNNYYTEMHEKLEKFLTKLQVRYKQVAAFNTVSFVSLSSWASSNAAVSLLLNNSSGAPAIPVEEGSALVTRHNNSDDEVCESPDCLSSDSSEEMSESEELIEQPNNESHSEQKYLSSLRFLSCTLTASSLRENKDPKDRKIDLERDFQEADLPLGVVSSISKSYRVEFGDGDRSNLFADQITNSPPEGSFSVSGLLEDPSVVHQGYPEEYRLNAPGCFVGLSKRTLEFAEVMPFFRGNAATSTVLTDRTLCTKENGIGTRSSSILCMLQPLDIINRRNFLSMNPVLPKITHTPLKNKSGVKDSIYGGQFLPCFDFTSVEDPFKICLDKLDTISKYQRGSEPPFFGNSSASTIGIKKHRRGEEEHGLDSLVIANKKGSCISSPLGSKGQYHYAVLTNVSGGSSWETMLGSCRNNSTTGVRDQGEHLSANFKIPLDIVIEKCILQEILLQYVSRLTIKLLEEGFDLHEHLLSLRRYHFMERADWADLFIMSLWQHKQFSIGIDRSVSDVQELLEMSIQRSSCEGDNNKDRLFVYTKENDRLPQSTAIGVHSFDFLGLGYRVDWPVSIILTSAALNIYSQIFNFLIKVKLAAFSLSNVWCLLKGAKHISQSGKCELQAGEVNHFTILMNMRHQLNHFVSMLQQYVQSQLSHVSWSGFLHSLQHKVKDMMDLESVHLEYLAESLDICFLSEETRDIGGIIRNILQCAMDFRGTLYGGAWSTGGQVDLSVKQPIINFSQVGATKETFEKNLKELHLIYLRSAKHGKFGLSKLWSYLNYNDYFTNSSTQHAVLW